MIKTGRNEPCPCGSGKKYKRCCMEKTGRYYGSQQEDSSSPSSGLIEEIKKELKEESEKRGIESPEDFDQLAKELFIKKNQAGLKNFLGLSPQQMRTILYKSFEECGDIVLLDINIKEIEAPGIPQLEKAWFFLNRLREQEPLKATQKGNLPRKFVLDLFENLIDKEKKFRYTPRKEEDSYDINSLRHILSMAGLIKLQKNKFTLTRKAKTIIEKKDNNALYRELFMTAGENFNWSYGDRYQELEVVQRSLVFNLYILREKANDWIEGKELGKIYSTAFPPIEKEIEHKWTTPENIISNIFSFRFLRKFCEPMGLVEKKVIGRDENTISDKYSYRATELFKKSIFSWKL
ncbi:MAG: SEC-C domain-containing protein [bacterium]|nr:SEC-C domain-containing protein [bacterium]